MTKDALRKALLKEQPVEDLLTKAMREICEQIQAVDGCFSEETDSDLLDAYIYERLSLQAKYRFLTRQARYRAAMQKGAESA